MAFDRSGRGPDDSDDPRSADQRDGSADRPDGPPGDHSGSVDRERPVEVTRDDDEAQLLAALRSRDRAHRADDHSNRDSTKRVDEADRPTDRPGEGDELRTSEENVDPARRGSVKDPSYEEYLRLVEEEAEYSRRAAAGTLTDDHDTSEAGESSDRDKDPHGKTEASTPESSATHGPDPLTHETPAPS